MTHNNDIDKMVFVNTMLSELEQRWNNLEKVSGTKVRRLSIVDTECYITLHHIKNIARYIIAEHSEPDNKAN